MSYGIIYKATNLVNGKVYIGQTTLTLHERMLQHKKDSTRLRNKNIAFYNAINKYGFENFNWCIIDEGRNRGDLDYKEHFWINFYRSYIHFEDSNGYNMTLGGDGLYGYKPSEETIRKLIKARKGYKHSEETKMKLRKAHLGIPKTKKHRENLSKSRLGKYTKENNPRSRAVIQLDLDGNIIAEYPSVTDAAKAVNGNTTKISRCCAGEYRHRSHKNFLWIYKEDYTEELVDKMVNTFKVKIKGRPVRPVVQLDLDGRYINRFDSVKQSVEAVGGTKKGVISCCKGERNEYKGFKWMYEEDYLALTEA